MSILKVRDLKKTYKKGFIPKSHEVLKGVNFTLEKGVVTGFLGKNGAGKTTTMKCLLGLAFPSDGDIRFFEGLSLSRSVRSRIGFLPERPYFYDYLTGREFLQFYGSIGTSFKKSELRGRIETLLKKIDLTFAADRKLRSYSKGMLQKIGLAQALIHNPEFIILDEPMSGLDPDGRYYVAEIVKEVAKEGTSVFFSSHLLNDAERLCESLVILKNGIVAYEGTTAKLLEKVHNPYSLTYLESGEEKTVEYSKQEECQIRINEIIKNSGTIIEVKPIKLSLEEAFVNLALKEDE